MPTEELRDACPGFSIKHSHPLTGLEEDNILKTARFQLACVETDINQNTVMRRVILMGSG